MGYIGSHTVTRLLEAGAKVHILDNLCNSKIQVIDRIQQITGKNAEYTFGDIRDRHALRKLFESIKFDAVIHFAGLKAVGESVVAPLDYYDSSVAGSVVLLQEMERAALRTLVFSSSATVYGDPEFICLSEDSLLKPKNPYGQSKAMVERVLEDIYKSDSRWRIACLRYFNPVGAHASGLIGEDPCGDPNNLMPVVAQVALGKRSKVTIFGDDYQTPDGTGLRDYIHVDDLAAGHLAALSVLEALPFFTVNLGTGRAYSVLELIRNFEKASQKCIPFEVAERRVGDIAACFADPARAKKLLGWEAKLGIERMCTDAWRWYSNSPQGYQ